MDNPLEVILHPIRMRILMILAGRELSARYIAEELGDVPQATVYRQLNRLYRAGVLEIAAERQVRGTVEKIYGLNEQYAGIDPERLSEVSAEDHRRYFAAFVASLLEDFSRYAQGADRLDLLADGVGYRKFPMELSDRELADMTAAVNAAMRPYIQNKSAPGRKRRIVATIMLPDRPSASKRDDGETTDTREGMSTKQPPKEKS